MKYKILPHIILPHCLKKKKIEDDIESDEEKQHNQE